MGTPENDAGVIDSNPNPAVSLPARQRILRDVVVAVCVVRRPEDEGIIAGIVHGYVRAPTITAQSYYQYRTIASGGQRCLLR